MSAATSQVGSRSTRRNAASQAGRSAQHSRRVTRMLPLGPLLSLLNSLLLPICYNATRGRSRSTGRFLLSTQPRRWRHSHRHSFETTAVAAKLTAAHSTGRQSVMLTYVSQGSREIRLQGWTGRMRQTNPTGNAGVNRQPIQAMFRLVKQGPTPPQKWSEGFAANIRTAGGLPDSLQHPSRCGQFKMQG